MIRRHSDTNLPRSNIDATSVGLQTWPVCHTHPLPLFPSAEPDLGFWFVSFSLLVLVGHCALLLASRQRPDRATRKYSLDWNQPESGCNHCMAHETWNHA